MFIVLEIQNNGGTLATLVNTYETLNAAEQQYHTVLAYAAVSTLTSHGAVILNSYGEKIKGECYTRNEIIGGAE